MSAVLWSHSHVSIDSHFWQCVLACRAVLFYSSRASPTSFALGVAAVRSSSPIVCVCVCVRVCVCVCVCYLQLSIDHKVHFHFLLHIRPPACLMVEQILSLAGSLYCKRHVH